MNRDREQLAAVARLRPRPLTAMRFHFPAIGVMNRRAGGWPFIMGDCAVAADTKVETPEGALTIKSVAGKAVAVFTRDTTGRVRFRMMRDVSKLAEQQPVLKITLENGMSFRVAPQQVLFKTGMVESRADALIAGDALVPAFHFPAGYRFQTDGGGARCESTASLRVVDVESGGAADIFTVGVNRTGCFFVSAGVLCKAAGTTTPV